MATIVASRYAVLSVDDDDDEDDVLSNQKKKIPNKKQANTKPQNFSTSKSDSSTKKKKKPENIQPHNPKNPNKTNSAGRSSKKKMEPTAEQWEEWKQKDAAYVEESFEEDLSKAILLSKLDFERNKDAYDETNKGEEKKNSTKKNRKGQRVMSLNEFNNLDTERQKNDLHLKSTETKEDKKNKFFSNLDEDIEKDVAKERLYNNKVQEAASQESLTVVLYKAYIEKKDRQIVELKAEVQELNALLKNVKTRNTKLCQIIANGEMKDKAEVLMEVERLQTIKHELSAEVATLHVLLEQERSKVRQLLSEPRNKDKKMKRERLTPDP